MIPPNDVVADLPAPMDDEPASVRQDIADELADHLACAYRRELLKSADDRTARQRVLDRFGNPQRIAYQLWFQALWGRIMLNRFTRVWQGLKIVAGVVAIFYAIRVAEQQTALHNQLVFLTASNNSMQSQSMGTRALLEQLLSRLPAPTQPAGDAGGMSPMGMPGMMGTSDIGMYGGSEYPGMGASMMGGGGPTAAGTPQKAGLKLRLTMQGETESPAAGCYVSVSEEGGATLSPYNDHSGPDAMGSMGMMSSGGMGSAAGMAGGMPGGLAFGGSGKQLNNGAFGYLVSPQMQGAIYFAKTVDSRLPPPPFLEPGRYVVTIEFPDGRTGTHRFVVPPQHKAALHEEHILCPPGDQKAYVTFHTSPVEKPYDKLGVAVRATLLRKSSRLDKTEWNFGTDDKQWDIVFDPLTGASHHYETSQWLNPPRANANIDHQRFDLAELPAEHRFLALPAGTYSVRLVWTKPSTAGGFAPSSLPVIEPIPAEGAATKGELVISEDTRDVMLEFPAEAMEALKKQLPSSTDAEVRPADAVQPESPPGF